MLADVLAPLETAVGVCAHCGQPVRADGLDTGPRFCCAGCRTVYSILHGSGLSAYYDKREAVGAEKRAAAPSGRGYESLDAPEFQALHATALPDGRLRTELFLENVHCAACVWLVEKVGDLVPGVTEARLDLPRATLRITWNPLEAKLSAVGRTLDSLGYPSHPLAGLDRSAVRRKEDRALLMKLGVAGAAAGNAMLFAAALYSGAFSGMDPEYVSLFRIGSAVVAIPSVFWCASVFHRGALSAIRTRTPHMDLPVSIGVLVGTASGLFHTWRGEGEIFFDTLTMLVFLLLVGRFLQQREQRRADGASEFLQALTPKTARLVEGTDVREVPVDAVPRGALVEIRSGDHVPVDGTVVEGTSSVDVSLLTGESLPAEVGPNASVHAGCVNVSGRIVVRADRTGVETRLSRLVEAMREAAGRRAPVVVLANRLAGYFVVIVLVAAALTALVLWHRGPEVALSRAVALLVVTCPCALGLATPLAVSAALGRAARRGIMIKGGTALEALARPGLVVFDKTGTLTEGKLSVVRFAGSEDAKAFASAAEAGSAHPIARALVAAFGKSALTAESTKETFGHGVAAVVGGKAVVAGSVPFVESRATLSDALRKDAEAVAAEALTPVVVAVDGEALAVVGIGDRIRPDARASLEALAALGHRLAVLSGDQPKVVGLVAAQIGVPFETVIGGASPEEKVRFVEARAAVGPVFMVGDGVNDASALSVATVGIAVRGGAEASLAASDVFCTEGGLRPVVEVFDGARETRRLIRSGLARSLVYNLAVGALAATGIVGPLAAAVLMPVSSISVVTSSYRGRSFRRNTP
ncbi:MAG TPA: heavy metal translocating P-type ATPase [Polyangiaceae bacterium]|nr:heavy metal translocating P-type ATPase [Polyangiaceae bacterium]